MKKAKLAEKGPTLMLACVPVLWGACWLGLCAGAARAAEAVRVQPVDLTQFLIEPNRPSRIAWRVECKLADDARVLVRDYWCREIRQVELERVGDDQVAVTVNLPAGYYELEFPSGGPRFGVVAIKRFEGRPDTFFAIDTALSWLVPAGRKRADLIRILRRCGIRTARERVSWGQINPSSGRWQWDAGREYETLRWLYADWGVGVLEMWHDAPGWVGRVGRLPQDLVATSRSWQRVMRKWRPAWVGLELWNEPDIHFGGNVPADQYVALVRTMLWASHRAGLEVPLVGGVFALFNQDYLRCAAANRLADLVDVISFHTYRTAVDLEEQVAAYRNWLAQAGRGGMPLWITESGRPWRRGPDRPPQGQDAASALDITMKAIESRACGIERYFAFVYPFYEERKFNFGMMDRSGTPLRSFAAYAYATTALAHKHYVGDLVVDDERVKRARVFRGRKETVIVVYTGTADGETKLRLDLPIQRAAGIDGRRITVEPHGTIYVGDGLAYVWTANDAVAGRLKRDTTAMQLSKLTRNRPPEPPRPQPIVPRLLVDESALKPSAAGYELKGSAASVKLSVRVFNLGDSPCEVQFRCAVPKGTVAERCSPETATIPGQSFADVTWRIKFNDLPKSGRTTVRFAVSSSNYGTVPLVVDLLAPQRGSSQ